MRKGALVCCLGSLYWDKLTGQDVPQGGRRRPVRSLQTKRRRYGPPVVESGEIACRLW